MAQDTTDVRRTELINEIAEGAVLGRMGMTPAPVGIERLAGLRHDVSTALVSHPSVQEAHVTVREGGDGRTELVACVVPYPRCSPTIGGRKRVNLPNGLSVVCADESLALREYRLTFEHQLAFRHGGALPPAGCIVDLAAGIGMFPLLARSVRGEATIYAIEPDRDTCELLRLNLALYAPDIPVVHANPSTDAVEWDAFTARFGLARIDLLHIHIGEHQTEPSIVETTDLPGVLRYVLHCADRARAERIRTRLIGQGFDVDIESGGSEDETSCYVYARRPETGRKQDVAAMPGVLPVEQLLSAAEVRSYLATQVPDAPVSDIVLLEVLPRSEAGDVDDQAVRRAIEGHEGRGARDAD